MDTLVVAGLVSLLTALVVRLVDALLTRRRERAELVKSQAEAERTDADAAEAITRANKTLTDMMDERVRVLREDTERRSKENRAEIEALKRLNTIQSEELRRRAENESQLLKQITVLQASDIQRQAQISQLEARDAERLVTIEKLQKLLQEVIEENELLRKTLGDYGYSVPPKKGTGPLRDH